MTLAGRFRALGVTASLAATSFAQIAESAPGGVPLVHIRVTQAAHATVIPDTLFGSFLEPIRQATYGGLWADVVENPSFEDGLWSSNEVVHLMHDRPELYGGSQVGLPLPWQPLDVKQGSRYAPVRGDAANSYQSLLIMALPGIEVGVRERVYLPVQRELAYHGAIWVKHVEGNGAVRISLRRRDQPAQVVASATLQATSATWTRYPYALALPPAPGSVPPQTPLDLVISLSDEARAQVDNVSLIPDDAIEGMDPEVLALARGLRTPVVRFGGNFTSAYDWHHGVGPMEKRVSEINLSWGIPEYNTFGTDEFLAFCRLIGAQPQIALNLGTGTPAQAAEWVRYVNQHWGDHRGGLLWELGNELWGDFQTGYPTLQRVAAKTLSTSEAVLAVDPNARLIATGGDEDFFHDWNAAQLSTPASTFKFLSTHFVVNDRVQLANPAAEFVTKAVLALPWGLGARMQQIKEQMVAAGRPDVKIAFTEWLTISDAHTGSNAVNPDFSNLGGGLFAGGFLNMLLRNADAIAISDMTGVVEFGGIVKRKAVTWGTPTYWVLRAYSTARPHSLLEVANDSPTYSVSHGSTRLPEIADVPYLDVTAARSEDGRSILLFCVNRSVSRAQAAALDLSALGITSGTAQVATITGETILAENDESHPRDVIPAESTERVTSSWQHIFPKGSVTVLRVDAP